MTGITKVYAYDFSAVCETGQTLYYNIIDSEYHYVELTYPDINLFWTGYTEPTGNVILPKYVYDANNELFFVTSIGNSAFLNCSELTSITISNFVNTIGRGVFSGCSGLEQIVVNAQNTVFDSRDNCNAIVRTSSNELVIGCKNTVIPNSVTEIGSSAFSGCSGLTGELIIHNSITSIGNEAFRNCIGLTAVTISNSVTSIGQYAFEGCSGLTGELNIPNSVTHIGNNPFSGCSGLEQITVSTENPVYDSRNNCNAIIETSTNKLVVGCKNTIIPNSVTKIGWCAFSGCSGLTGELNIPNSVVTIGFNAFADCIGLTGKLTIPNSVITIDNAAFSGCSSLTSITIGKSVTTIGSWAFSCNGLSSINMLTITPPTLVETNAKDAFVGTSNTLEIYVPYESLNDYKTATNWSNYESRIFPMAYKTIPAHGGSGGWGFIASPLLANTAPTEIDNMIAETESNFDLYRFNQSAELEWENWKSHANNDDHYHFNLKNGQGYLYANAEDVNLIFKGTFNENSTKTINLIYEAGEPLAGWNLVGNPFPVAATISGSSYYVMNEDGTALNPIPVSSGGTVPACTGIMVHATVLGQPITFNTSVPETQNQNNGTLQIAVVNANTRGNTIEDKAVVSFNEGDDLGKFYFGESNANIYFPKGSEEFAITSTDRVGEMPLNFKASSNGQYTLSVNPEDVEMDYLHLIDNMTGADVDLVTTSTYTFNAKTTDYVSRFRLVFVASSVFGDEDVDNEVFAFYSNGNYIITNEGEATLQVIDEMGHILSSEHISGCVSKAIQTTPGIYVIRLIKGEKAKMQKIVVK